MEELSPSSPKIPTLPHQGSSSSPPVLFQQQSLPSHGSFSSGNNLNDPVLLKKSLRSFCEQGSWRNVYKLTEAIKFNEKDRDVFFYEVKYCRMLSLVKLRMFKNAGEEAAALDLSSSIVPFSLRLLQAMVPSFSGSHQQALDLLFGVLDWLNTRDVSEVSPTLHASRIRRTRLAQVAVLARQRDYLSACDILEDMATRDEEDGEVLSTLGQMCLELGDIERAKKAYEKAEKALNTPNATRNQRLQVHMNAGLLNFALCEYEKAITCFDTVLEFDSLFTVAATNNKALCLLFTCNLQGAVAMLEGPLHSNPRVFLDEVSVFNLCTLIDLHSERPGDKKNDIIKLVAANGDDAFDTSIINSGNATAVPASTNP